MDQANEKDGVYVHIINFDDYLREIYMNIIKTTKTHRQ